MTNGHAEMTWREWFASHGLTELCQFPDDVLNQSWRPTDSDRKAAWELYTEMRTRISTQPLHYRSGVEQSALESIVQLFRLTRELLKKYGPESRHFATICVEVLNVHLRPFTARWHKLSEAGRLKTDDGRHIFRGELLKLQKVLRAFQELLGRLAEGSEFLVGTESGFRTVDRHAVSLGGPIPYDRLQGLSQSDEPDSVYQQILSSELHEITTRRKNAGLPDNTDDLVGLAISGGGIRSATFALGVIQGIAGQGLFKEIDLLSTVSGGGYLGGFLSSYLNEADSPEEASDDIGPNVDQLPFQQKENCESGPLRFLRNHSRYLLPAGFSGRMTMIGQGLYGVLMNLVILLPLLMGAVLITHYAYLDRMKAVARAVQANDLPLIEWQHFIITIGVAAVWGVFVFFLPLIQKLARVYSGKVSSARSAYETICVGLFAITLVTAIVEAVPLGYYAFLRISEMLGLFSPTLEFTAAGAWVLFGNLVTFASARGLLWQPKETASKEDRQISIFRKLAFLILALAGPVLLIVIFFLLCHWLLVMRPDPDLFFGSLQISARVVLWTLFLLPLVYTFCFLNVNLISPQRYYRNRLAETYLLKPDATAPESVHSVDPQLLSQLGSTGKAPYHLINGALNLPASRVDELRGRNADVFLFSKHFCGSPIVGYFPTKKWEAVDGYLDLGTAVAISGAAASPHMGSTTPRGASFFLTLLNIRLGYWLRRPDVCVPAPGFVKALDSPGPTYLFREMFGLISERSVFFDQYGLRPRYLNISDGGHIENLAIYELLRRRCKFIIAIDGECDPQHEFPSLMKLQQYAWIDFGTSIDLDVNRLRLTDDGWSQAHIAFGKIHYHSGEQGFLLYIKLSVTGNEKDYLLDYHGRNAPFPHQSTLDQLFDEAQFEAYRALGEHVTEDLFCDEFIGDHGQSTLTIRQWFQGLANNLLQD